jgi:two-component system, NtrC family, response regulator PilR
MQQVRALIDKVARSQAPVFITGETGTGKEVAARLIHAPAPVHARRRSSRSTAARSGKPDGKRVLRLPQGGLHRRGKRPRRFLPGGAWRHLFLDEVADLPLPMQVKLLRAIQEKACAGSAAWSKSRWMCALISASHQDLQAAVTSGRFRHDLFYRLNVIEIRMPACASAARICRNWPRTSCSLVRPACPDRSRCCSNPPLLRRWKSMIFQAMCGNWKNMLERGMALADNQVESTSSTSI